MKNRFIAKIKKFPRNVLTFLCYIIGMTPVISFFVVIYWAYHRTARKQSYETHPNLTGAIYVSSFIFLLAILYGGIKSLLFFLPYSWGGYTEDGEWWTYRNSIAGLFSFAGSYYTHTIFEKYAQLKDYVEDRNIPKNFFDQFYDF